MKPEWEDIQRARSRPEWNPSPILGCEVPTDPLLPPLESQSLDAHPTRSTG